MPFPCIRRRRKRAVHLEELFAGQGIDLADYMERLKRVAYECNLPWGARTRTYNSRRAQE